MIPRKVLNFIAESGQLKRVPRSGWSLAGIPDPESVAAHVYRTAIIGHILAHMEGEDPTPILVEILYHDLPEARIGDLHKIAQRYLSTDQVSTTVLSEQLAPLSPMAGATSSKEDPRLTTIAKDADRLECIIQGKEYYDMGYTQAKDWFDNKADILQTKSAQKIYQELLNNWDSTEWRNGLKKKT